MRKVQTILLIFLSLVLAFTACGKSDESMKNSEKGITPPMTDEFSENEQNDELGEEIQKGILNPLTGIYGDFAEEKMNRMPVAIMINNLKKSLPQKGISKADIIYEIQAEGGITRMLAIFQDPSQVGDIGTVRSSRSYYINMAQSHNAIYMHFGASQIAYDTINQRKDLIALDGIRGGWEGTLYYRDAKRRKKAGMEHSVFTSGERIEDALSSLNNDILNKDVKPAFSFNEQHSALNGQSAYDIKVPYSGYITGQFKYDMLTGEYKRYQYGQEHIDEEYKKQLSFKNVFVLRMETSLRENNPYGWLKVVTMGTGKGFYACEGKYIPITWEKHSYNSQIKYYKQDGSEVLVCPGKTFVAIATQNTDISLT